MSVNVLEAADFDWAKHIDKIWVPDPFDIPDMQPDVRNRFARALAGLAGRKDDASPLGMVMTGPGGSGKTHLLGSFCRQTVARGGYFIIVDMAGVKNFWDTVLLHLVRSLRTVGPDGRAQIDRLLADIVTAAQTGVDAAAIPSLPRNKLVDAVKKTLAALYARYGAPVLEHMDALRAAFLLPSNDLDISSCGRQWLLGLPSAAVKPYGFGRPACDAKTAVAGLSWLMSLNGRFSVLALDQLDGIVKQHYLAGAGNGSEEARTAMGIVLDLCEGLLALRDITRRGLTVVSCLADTWAYLKEYRFRTASDRYDDPVKLSPPSDAAQIERMISIRMAAAFAATGGKAPYPTWPFPPSVLRHLKNAFPRAVLQYCDKHIKACIYEGVAREAAGFGGNEPEPVAAEPEGEFRKRADAMEKRFQEERAKAVPAAFKNKDAEDGFWRRALPLYAQAFCYEQEAPIAVNLLVDSAEQADDEFPLAHAVLRRENPDDDGRDRRLCLGALMQPHHRAFQTRLKGALTQSDIDHQLSFRKLALVHFDNHPGGEKTRELLDQFEKSDGVWVIPTDDEVRSLAALSAVAKEFPTEWRDWAAQTKPTRRIGLFRDQLSWLMDETEAVDEVVVEPVDARPAPTRRGADASLTIPVGKRLVGGIKGGEVRLSLGTLKRHVAVIAGSGSGKTVLLKRLVEEAALNGTPAIVIDGANDLARMGRRWPGEPPGWSDDDRKKAKEYFERVEVKIWTPGLSDGNPLRLRKIPDLQAVRDNEDELTGAVSMSLGALRGIIPMRDKAREGVVATCLRWMARNGGGDLSTLAEVLSELPDDSGALDINRSKAGKWAEDMAGQLKGALMSNPLLRSAAAPTDMADLLTGRNGKTRISVVNLSALADKDAQQAFLNELAMTLFGWIKANPTPGLGGLFVIDEAKDFVPSQQSTPCKESVIRFAAQARKYGMGLVLATQEPKSVDTKIIANCNTQFFGRQNSPATIEAAENLLQKYGVVGKLKLGNFFLKSVELEGDPLRIETPLCLSHHSSAPLDKNEVAQLAKSGT